MGQLREALRIVGTCVGCAVLYGVAHDLVTAHLSVEYFTVAHPPIGTDDPFLLALVWGVLATWWVGVLLGVPLAAAARLGRAPRVAAVELRPAIVRLLVVMGVAAAAMMLLGVCVTGRAPIRCVDSRLGRSRRPQANRWIRRGSAASLRTRRRVPGGAAFRDADS